MKTFHLILFWERKFVLEPNTKTPSRTVVVESGIDSSERQATLENRNAMLVTTGLLR